MCFCTPSIRTPFCSSCNVAMFQRIGELRAELATAEAWRRENNDLIIELNVELAEAKKDAERFKRIIIEVREALQFANDTPNGPICDTIWMMHRAETLFDFIDGRMEEMKEQQCTTNE